MISGKKGGPAEEFVLWFFRFFILVVIIWGVIFMVYNLQKADFDVRDTETVLISQRITDCITKNNEVTEDSIDNFARCIELDKETSYMSLSVFNSAKELKKAEFGRQELAVFCSIEPGKQKYPPACLQQSYIINFNGGSSQLAYLDLIVVIGSKNV